MLELRACSTTDIAEFGYRLLNRHRENSLTFEAVARSCAQAIYDEFRQPDGQSVFALFRVFRITPYHELPAELSAEADSKIAYWVTLAGTFGDKPEWCNRRLSKGHQLIPENKAWQAPMLRALFQQLGLQWGDAVDTELLTQPTDLAMIRYFYVPEALGSPHIAAQDEFVRPHGISSVIGVGSSFLSKAAFAAIGFSKAIIDAAQLQKFLVLAPYLSTVLARPDQAQRIWDKLPSGS